jgi:hypothetical protein
MRDPRYAASRVKSRFCCSSAHPPPTMQPHCCVLIHWTFYGRSVFQQPIDSTCMHSGCIVGCRLISSVSAYHIRTFRIRHDLFRTDSAHLHRYVHMRDFSVRKWRCRTLRNLPIGEREERRAEDRMHQSATAKEQIVQPHTPSHLFDDSTVANIYTIRDGNETGVRTEAM